MEERRLSKRGQIRVYLGKCFRLFRNEKQWINFISTFIIIAVISLVTGPDMFRTYSATRNGAFAILSACIWVGLFNSIRSVCRERDIIKREYKTGLRISSYVLAHVLYEMFICAVEALIILLFTCVRNYSHLPPEGVVFPMGIDLYLTFFLVTFCADMIAMLISCIVRDENTAMTVMPFVLVVQLVMAGVVFELSGVTELISRLTASSWGEDAVLAIARTDHTVEAQAWWAGEETDISGFLQRDWLILLIFCAVYIVAAMFFLRRVDRDER